MYALYRVSQGLDAFTSKVGKVFAWATVPLMLVIIYDVFTRNVLSSMIRAGLISDTTASSLTFMTSTKLQEMEWHLHGVLLLMTFGLAYMKDAHVRIELVRDKMRTRTRLWVELFGILLFLLPYCWIIMWFGWDFAMRSFDNGEVSAALTGLSHRWIIKSFVGLGFLMLFIAALSQLLRTLVGLFGPTDLRDLAGRFVNPQLDNGVQSKAD
ncbi:MAG: TRAP transporter small permease subunit [Rhodospirillum sp.]|nr:TRAP transporter small permease subunit [Rhodospirillum sp.]MCF8491739.1 TRAP transporter small permease subunit [Rhodospirillum sp.]MCF8501716.1 TRAP transporter small permease subunit [Rhodospirillum sp.]